MKEITINYNDLMTDNSKRDKKIIRDRLLRASKTIIKKTSTKEYTGPYSAFIRIFHGYPDLIEKIEQLGEKDPNGILKSIYTSIEEMIEREESIKSRAGRLATRSLAVLREVLTAEVKLHPPTKKTTTKNKYYLVLQISDLHIGSEYKTYFGLTNTEIILKSFFEYIDKVIEIATKYKDQIDSTIFILGGDICDGENIFAKQPLFQQHNINKQAYIGAKTVLEGIKRVSEAIQTEIHVYAVPGNHGRMAKRDDPINNRSNADLLSYQIMKFICPELNIKIARNDTDIFIHKDRVAFIVSHGHEITPYTVRNKVKNRQLATLSALEGLPSVYFYHHIHFPDFFFSLDSPVVINGALQGITDYTVDKGMLPAPKVQNLLIFEVLDNTVQIKGLFPIIVGTLFDKEVLTNFPKEMEDLF